MSISRRNNRALNRVLRDSLRARTRPEPPPRETDAPAYTLCADIPESYDDSYVRAIPKDPQNTFVYWELPKDRAEASLFADRGTAHVGNDEAVRIGEQLNESHRRRQADWNNRDRYGFDGNNQQHHGVDDYHQVSLDNRNQYNFDGNNQKQHGVNDYHQADWDNRNQYGFDGGNQQHNHGVDDYHQAGRDNNQYGVNEYHQTYWDNGNQYNFDSGGGRHRLEEAYQHLRGLHAGNQYNWDDGGQYRRDDVYRHLRHNLQEGIYQLNWDDGGRSRRDGGDAFSEMLEALIERCGRYIADYRQSGSAPPADAMSSGLLRDAAEEPRK